MAFTNFLNLPQELRDQIWADAAVIQCQHIIDSHPEPCTIPHAERQRQALVGYDNLPDSIQRQYLRLYIHASAHTDELCHGESELHTLLTRFPMASACSDARATAVKFCRTHVKVVDLFRMVEDPRPSGRPLLDPVFTDMPTVQITTSRFHPEDGPAGFDSPAQLVDVLARVFGRSVQKIIWGAWCQSGFAMDWVYWPHTPQLRHLDGYGYEMIINQSGHHETAHFMTRDHILHIKPTLYKTEIPDGDSWYDKRVMFRHALKISELLDAAAEVLPMLQDVEIDMRTYVWGEPLRTYVETTYKDDRIWIGRNNLNTAINHDFSL